MHKPKVAFICVHNACRSQMAEAISKLKASDVFEAYSAGTDLKTQINSDAAAVIRKLYGIDMRKTQGPKSLEKLPSVDYVITMGCHVSCPFLSAQYREDWGLEDPTGKGEEVFIETAKAIEQNIMELKHRIKEKETN